MPDNVQKALHLFSTIHLTGQYDLYSLFTGEATETQGGSGAPSNSASRWEFKSRPTLTTAQYYPKFAPPESESPDACAYGGSQHHPDLTEHQGRHHAPNF